MIAKKCKLYTIRSNFWILILAIVAKIEKDNVFSVNLLKEKIL